MSQYLDQTNRFISLATKLGADFDVINTHTSHSFKIPVMKLSLDGVFFVLRDNFHDINLYVESAIPLDLSYGDIYPEYNCIWYLDQITKCRNYVFDGWTDDEMDDPRILRVIRTRANGSIYWSNVKPEVKDRWANRYISTEWWQDWSSGYLINEDHCSMNGKFWLASRAFCEGMEQYEGFQPFKVGTNKFVISTDFENTERITRLIAAMNGENEHA